MALAAIDLRRILLVARRDYLGYIKTWGFWISFLMPFIFMALAVIGSSIDLKVEPTRYEAIYDETGLHKAAIIAEHKSDIAKKEREFIERIDTILKRVSPNEDIQGIYDQGGIEAVTAQLQKNYPGVQGRIRLDQSTFLIVDPPAESLEALKSYVTGGQTFIQDGEPQQLDGILHLYEEDGEFKANHWSPFFNTNTEKQFYSNYFRTLSTKRYLEEGGLNLDGLRRAQSSRFTIESFDPTKSVTEGPEGQAVTTEDTVPYLVAVILSVFLWFTIFSASYMLLTSMLEEKLNKLLEMMLASTRMTEIIFGKLLGVAALTFTAMIPYFGIGVATILAMIAFGDPNIVAGIMQGLSPKMLVFFPVFMICGYLFYGSMFIAMGILANSMQDAQTLSTPIMLLLSACFLVVPLGITAPQSPWLTFAAWFPLSAPFANIVRLPLDPPWWELVLAAGFVLLCAILITWFATRVFRYGVLSGAGLKGVFGWFKRVVLRRKTDA